MEKKSAEVNTKMLEEISREQFAAYGDPSAKRVVINVRNVEYVAKSPDGKYWRIVGMDGAKEFLAKYGAY